MRATALTFCAVAACSQGPFSAPDAYVALDAPAQVGAGPGGGQLDNLVFAVVGDSRPANPDDTANYPTAVVHQIFTDVAADPAQPRFAVTTGDYMDCTTTGEQVDPQLDLYLDARAAYPGVVYPAMGNHELHGSGGLENWWNAFPELRGRRWYSVEFGNAYFITVDSNLDLTPGSVQSAWVAKQLENLPKGTQYVFVSLHHPPMADPIAGDSSHDVRPNEAALAQQLEAAAKQISAKIIVAAGHIHAYERFERGGVVYLVSGGGGAAQYKIARTPGDLYQDNVFPNFHYVKFENGTAGLKATMYRLNENGSFVVGDSFTVGAKSAAAGAK